MVTEVGGELRGLLWRRGGECVPGGAMGRWPCHGAARGGLGERGSLRGLGDASLAASGRWCEGRRLSPRGSQGHRLQQGLGGVTGALHPPPRAAAPLLRSARPGGGAGWGCHAGRHPPRRGPLPSLTAEFSTVTSVTCSATKHTNPRLTE